MVESVVSDGLNRVKHPQAAAAEQFDVDAEPQVERRRQRKTQSKEFSRSRNEVAHQLHISIVESALEQAGFREAGRREHIDRNVDSVFIEVARDILPKICELQGGARVIGEILPLPIAISTEIEHEPPNGICRVPAVLQDGVPVWVPVDRLILAESDEQMTERIDRNVEAADRIAKRDEYRMRGAARVTFLQLALPPIQKFHRSRGIGNLISQIVGPPAVCIDVVEMLPQPARQQIRGDREILVMMGGEPARVFFGQRQRASGRRKFPGEFEVGRQLHTQVLPGISGPLARIVLAERAEGSEHSPR